MSKMMAMCVFNRFIFRQHSLREERLRRITERPNEEEEFSDEVLLLRELPK